MIQTKRLRLVPASDAQMARQMEETPVPELKAAYGEMLSGATAHPDEREWYVLWNIELTDTPGTVVGNLCFHGTPINGAVELGYGTNPGFEGRGYMTEAVTAVAAWAAAQPGVLRVEAETAPDNAASMRVLQKAGFVPTGAVGDEGPRFVWRGEICS